MRVAVCRKVFLFVIRVKRKRTKSSRAARLFVTPSVCVGKCKWIRAALVREGAAAAARRKRVLTHIQQLYRTLRQSLTKSSFTARTQKREVILGPETVSGLSRRFQQRLLLGFFFCIVNVGLIKISTSSLREEKTKTKKNKSHFSPRAAASPPRGPSPVVPEPRPTYVDAAKEVEGVCVWEGGFLNALPVLCDKRHGLHGELGR